MQRPMVFWGVRERILAGIKHTSDIPEISTTQVQFSLNCYVLSTFWIIISNSGFKKAGKFVINPCRNIQKNILRLWAVCSVVLPSLVF